MARSVSEITLGIDVAKDELVIYEWNTEQTTTLANQPTKIAAWLKGVYGPVRLAVEPSSSYHLELVQQAQAAGWTVYPVNPRQLAHYRLAVGERHKTDATDAALLARYLAHEADSLRPFKPLDAKAQRLWALLKRRAIVVSMRQQLQQSFRDLPVNTQAPRGQLQCLIAHLEQLIRTLIAEFGWQADYHRCLSIPGIGAINAAALTAVFHRGTFAGSDAFVAFIGLDVRLRESGKFKGQSKLSKCGEPEIRRLLYCAAQASRSYPLFAAYHQQQLDKGLCKIAAAVVLARKIARIAFSLLSRQQSNKKKQSDYCKTP